MRVIAQAEAEEEIIKEKVVEAVGATFVSMTQQVSVGHRGWMLFPISQRTRMFIFHLLAILMPQR